MRLVRTAAALRWALLRGSLRAGSGATGRRIGLVVGALLGGVLSVLAFTGLAATRGHGRVPEDLAVLLFTVVAAGWILLPVVTFGSDDLLDPARLALLPLSGRDLLTVMGVGALIGVAPAATTVAALGLLPATGRGPASVCVALLAVLLLLALCVSTSRATAAALSGLLRSRRGRDLGVAVAALVALGFQLLNPLIQLGARSGGEGAGALHSLAGPLRWTPPGLLAAAPGRSLPAAGASLLAVAGVVAAVLALWERSVRRSLERADRSTGGRRRRRTGLIPRGVPLPAGRAGAVAAKDLRYLFREPRRMVALLTAALLPVLAVSLGPLTLGRGHPSKGLVFAVSGVALFGGLGGANRFGMDGTATWLLLSSATDPLDARRDLTGGDLAAAVVTVPLLVAFSVALAALTGGWANLPPALGVALALFAVNVALSGVVAVAAPYAVPPSQNAFSSGGTGQGCAAGGVLLLAALTGMGLCLPLLGVLVPALVFGSPAWGLALLVLGPAYGLVVGAVLRRRAAARWAARGPEVLQIQSAARA